jgi:hypothetical protein
MRSAGALQSEPEMVATEVHQCRRTEEMYRTQKLPWQERYGAAVSVNQLLAAR